jgi:hypothetical protein
LTNTGRGHLTPAISSNRGIVFASREGSSYEIFSGQLGAAVRTRRPTLIGVNRLTDQFHGRRNWHATLRATATGSRSFPVTALKS